MNFNKHSNLVGEHAFLGASNYHWLNYDEEKLEIVYRKNKAKSRGTVLHGFAALCIRLRQKLPRSAKTLNMYVNDAIGYKMTPEQVLYYSPYCFGTADTISFRNNELRIHDYKSGVVPAHIEQLRIYAALFCLEYNVDPIKITTVLRIYQSNEIFEEIPEPEIIRDIMTKIIRNDRIIAKIEEEESALDDISMLNKMINNFEFEED